MAPWGLTVSTLARIFFDPDTIPPSVPNSLTATAVSSTRIDLSWGPSTDTGGSGVAGYLVYRGSTQIATASSTAYSDTGLTPSTAYQYQVAAVDGAGNVSSKSSVAPGTTLANSGVPAYLVDQPKIGFWGLAGARTFTDPTQLAFLGRFNLLPLGISGWEAWANSGRNADTSVVSIHAQSTAPGGTIVMPYGIGNYIEQDANDPFPTWTAEVVTRNWILYSNKTTGLVTPSDPSTAATALVNYTDFVPVNPSLEHPWEFYAAYSYNKFLTKTKSDARFSALNPGLASSNFDGVAQDNFLSNPQIAGDWNRDGTLDQPGFPCAATPSLQQGQRRYVDRMRQLAPTKYVWANFGDLGVVPDPGVMAGVLDGGLCESYFGRPFSWETQLGWLPTMQRYYKALSVAINPQLCLLGGAWPDTAPGGGALTRLPTSGGYPPALTLDQWACYIGASAYMAEGGPSIYKISTGYSTDLTDLYWPWFAGGQSGQEARSWLGPPKDAWRPTTPKIAKGPIGIFGVEYTNGMVLVNPVGNGTQTITSADIPSDNWIYPAGSTQGTPAASFTSITVPERYGLFLKRAFIEGTSIVGNVVTIKRAAGGFGTKPGTAAPLFYNNFNSVAVGSTPSAVGLTNSIDATVVNVQNDRAYIGTQSLKGVFPPNVESFPEISFIPPANTSEIYISGAFYWTTSAPGSASQFIWKLTRMGCGTLYHGTPQQYFTSRPDATGAVTGGDWGYNDGGGTVAWCSSMYYSTSALPGPHANQWNFLEFAHKFSTSGGSNGYSEMRCNSQNLLPSFGAHSQFVNQTSGANLTTGNTNNSGSTANYSWVITFFDGLSVPGNTNTQAWLGFVYIDNCRNRVVVSDNAVLANSTKTKILMLICSQWTDAQLIGTNSALNAMFPSGSTAVFHVFNGAGNEVATYSVVMP
jgi:hypothetical protein